MTTRRGFLAGAIALITLGRLPKAKAKPLLPDPTGMPRYRYWVATYPGKLDHETLKTMRKAMGGTFAGPRSQPNEPENHADQGDME